MSIGPKPGETLHGGAFAQHAGGKGANQAVAAARAGAAVVFIGARGDDAYGKAALAGLRAEGINTRWFRCKEGTSSGVALIMIGGRERENAIAVATSANDTVSAADVHAAQAAFGKSGVAVAQLEVPLDAVQATASLAKDSNMLFVLNPAPARKLPKSLLALVDVIVPNEHEAVLLTGEKDVERAAAALLKAGCKTVVVTCGARGALVCDAAGSRTVSAPKVKPVDTVGAGDCFTGWLAVGLAEGLSVDAAASRAVKAASIAVTRPGAQSAMPRRTEVV